ncbi:hypothetical protein E2C01_033343 [Portunus trituberculatus]|uniref:Uncharacterized protein n=1 Tax=Portunus trituberculatus TaxID=210409 RepID=A0A5B7F5A5_PORTR|nr:hypothetical protein [Portunus trituberculatus]
MEHHYDGSRATLHKGKARPGQAGVVSPKEKMRSLLSLKIITKVKLYDRLILSGPPFPFPPCLPAFPASVCAAPPRSDH